MKDVFGTELQVGDLVATNMQGYTCELRLGTVIGFTPQKVKIVIKSYRTDREDVILKYPSQLAIGVKNGITGQEKEEPR